MEVLEIVLPVLAMIILGILCRKWKLLDQSGVNNMKTLVTNIMLPVAIFHALATAEYSGKIGILVLIMFVMPEKEREQCLCVHNKFSVLCGLNPGLYRTGSGRMMELKEGIK